MGEFEGAVITKEYVTLDGVSGFQCYKVELPSGEIRLVPKCDGNGDYERIKIWNQANGNPLEID